MMTVLRLLVAALGCALVVLASRSTDRAQACTFVLESDPLRAVAAAAGGSDVVVVGEVIREEPIEDDPVDFAVFDDRAFTSTVRVDAALKGEPERLLTLGPLGYLEPDCSGGPRLRAGERVVLFLSSFRSSFRVYAYEQGNYLLAGNAAYNENLPPVPAEDFVRRVAAATGAPQQELDAALVSLRGEAEPLRNDADNGGELPWLVVGLGGAVLAGLVVVLVWARRPASPTGWMNGKTDEG